MLHLQNRGMPDLQGCVKSPIGGFPGRIRAHVADMARNGKTPPVRSGTTVALSALNLAIKSATGEGSRALRSAAQGDRLHRGRPRSFTIPPRKRHTGARSLPARPSPRQNPRLFSGAFDGAGAPWFSARQRWLFGPFLDHAAFDHEILRSAPSLSAFEDVAARFSPPAAVAPSSVSRKAPSRFTPALSAQDHPPPSANTASMRIVALALIAQELASAVGRKKESRVGSTTASLLLKTGPL